MTKKRHAKLLRAFITRVHEYGRAHGYVDCTGRKMYQGVRAANDGFIPKGSNFETRLDWWQAVGKQTLDLFGMGDIKEVNR